MPTVDDIITLILFYTEAKEGKECVQAHVVILSSPCKPKHMVLVFLSNMHLCSAHFFFRITVAFLL